MLSDPFEGVCGLVSTLLSLGIFSKLVYVYVYVCVYMYVYVYVYIRMMCVCVCVCVCVCCVSEGALSPTLEGPGVQIHKIPSPKSIQAKPPL